MFAGQVSLGGGNRGLVGETGLGLSGFASFLGRADFWGVALGCFGCKIGAWAAILGKIGRCGQAIR